MKEVNFDAIYEHAGTRYGDLTGVIQLDGHSNITSIYELCRDYSVDLTNRFIVGFGLSDSSLTGLGDTGKAACSILSVDTGVYGSSYEAIEAKIKADAGPLTVEKTTVWVPYAELPRYIKRIDFLATTELTKHATSIEIVE